ncbi:uncharacterized protein C8Q71DRAFT_47551 [Rhodofomes roseus]|uniref:Uncharacterized protein n=1 Tax=Rhodofomes roseus TaxID=34475 RepID=A0ABQ8KG60_9APHY|nr:uncharacterized protein C8Q71DRAFT_47551 [Rhodofomes roseus]KAH9836545.1 hypothetical protein C8Q71DRAFT_47551 [Rhodofomes roseus]
MQRPSSYHAFSRCDSQVWTDWLHSERQANSSLSSSESATIEDDINRHQSKDDIDDAMPLCYASFLPSPPDSPLSASSSSQLSVVSAADSGYDELPEIPFVSSSPSRFDSGWNPMEGCSSRGSDDSHCERTFWASVIRPTASRSSEKSVPVLGQMSERSLAPSRHRAPSISSTASSRTRPAPAKSILSSSSSTRTRTTTRSPPSVKFLDMPTIHYEEEDVFEHTHSHARSVSEDSGKRSFLKWFRGASKKAQAAQERPTISGPFPLWETPPRRTPSGGTPSVRSTKSGAPSLRSMKSNNSLRSVRSCSSRLQTYWGRVTGREL